MRALKLSEAIRIGSLKSRQGFGFYRRTRRLFGFFKVREACTMGAALDAIESPRIGEYNFFCRTFPITMTVAHCPACPSGSSLKTLGTVIIELNDQHRWTRERIADFVESVENAQSANAGNAQSVSDRSEEHQEENRELSYA